MRRPCLTLPSCPFAVTGQNQTVNITYGRFISGPASVELSNETSRSIVALVNVPFDADQIHYDSWINLSDNRSYSVRVNIIDDVYFDIITDPACFAGSRHEIIPEAPLQSSLSLSINGKQVTWSGEQIIYYTPTKKGLYQLKAEFSYRNHSQTISRNFTAYDVIGCSVSAKGEVTENDSVSFSASADGGMGGMSYSWDFGDGKTSKEIAPAHAYLKPGKFDAELTVADDKGNKATCHKQITVKERTYALTIIIADNGTGRLLGDANVSLGDQTEKSNVDGKAKFSSITSGSYELGIDRAGYYTYSRSVSVSSDATLRINMSQIKEESMPVPDIELLYPDDSFETGDDAVNFRFRAGSGTEIRYCYLLYNDIDFLGYKIRGEIDSPESGREYSFRLNMTNGDFKWSVECENRDGTGMSEVRNITVRGLAEALKSNPEAGVQDEPKEPDAAFDADLSGFSSALQKITDAGRTFDSSGSKVRDVFDLMGFQSALDSGRIEISRIRQQMADLQNLQIADADKKSKSNEYLASFVEVSSKVPVKISITEEDSFDIDNSQANVTPAVDYYLRWKGYNLSNKQRDRYISSVQDAQKGISVSVEVMNVEVEFLDGTRTNYSIVTKDVDQGSMKGGELLEIIPKSVATSINKVTFSAPFELVEKDPVARIYLDNGSRFSYYVKDKVGLSELRQAQSVMVLDLSDPQNRITGFSILDTTTQTGKFFLVLILVGVVISANYLIFFREKDVRDRFVANIRGAGDSIRPRSPGDKLMMLLNNVIDQLNAGETESALGKYSRALELYDLSDPKLREDVKPIIEHMMHEMEVFNINRMIEDAYRKTISGRGFEAADTYSRIQDTFEVLPSGFKKKVSSKLDSLNIAMEIHRLKTHSPAYDEYGNVDDALFGGDRE